METNSKQAKPSADASDFLTTREAAQRLGVSLRTAQLWVDSGVLSAWKTEGGHRRILASSVDLILREQPGQPIPAQSSDPLLNLGALKVLVAEDDLTLLRVYRAQLSGWNLPIEVTTAANGYDALVLIGREQPDLMIADLAMPGIDGFQMVRALMASSFREGMEIIVVTGMDAAEIAAKGGLPDDMRIFSKPVPFGEIKALVEAMIARRAELARG